MHMDWPSVREDDDAAKTLEALANGDAPAVIVVGEEGHDVVGLITEDDIRRAIALASIGLGRGDRLRPAA